ncbi:cupin domain-containing protein [Microbacterium sp. NPDC057659]|uniref:cupin domain-containing protein n=1 Tax=Microbacterium sp. NPDC057659 TaxID=3346198 RepID=UPI00366BB0A7
MVETLAVPTLVAPDEIRLGTGSSRRFPGSEHGAGISYFYIDNQPGQGASLHWHPYPETWVVLEGDVTFVVGDEQILATAGDTVTGPAYVPHKFTNTGTGTMRLIGIHASAIIIQTDLDPSSGSGTE